MDIIEKWFGVCDKLMGKTCDIIEIMVITTMLMFFVVFFAYLILEWLWQKKDFRLAVGLAVFFIVLYVPISVIVAIKVIVRNKEPLRSGTKKSMRRVMSLYADALLTWAEKPSRKVKTK